MVIEEYNENWPSQFMEIKKVLNQRLSNILRIEHVGSTAIVGMCAKPIIDIDVVIGDLSDFESIKNQLEAAGYIHQGDSGIKGRDAFGRNGRVHDAVLDAIRHHLYVCTKNSAELRRHLLFRDYLNTHEEKRDEYNRIKKDIIDKYGNDDREKYVSAKETEYQWFFEQTIHEAEKQGRRHD